MNERHRRGWGAWGDCTPRPTPERDSVALVPMCGIKQTSRLLCAGTSAMRCRLNYRTGSPSPLTTSRPSPRSSSFRCWAGLLLSDHRRASNPAGRRKEPRPGDDAGQNYPSRNALSSGSRDPAQSREATRPPHGSLSSHVKHKFDQRLPHSVRRLTSSAPKRHEYAPILLSPIGT